METESETMLQLAAEAFQLQNFDLAADIYECQLAGLRDPGGRCELMIKRADALAFGGKFTEAFAVYRQASELERLRPTHLENLVHYMSGSIRRQQIGASHNRCPGRVEAAEALGCPDFGATGCGYEDVSCRICLSFLFEPVTLPCGHCFCKKCLEREKKERNQPVICRECRDSSRVADVQSYRVNVVLSNLLAKWFPTLHQAGRLRREGNGLYADKKVEAALEKYDEAILIAPLDHILFSNRSQIHSSLKHYEKALRDAEMACRLMPHWSKGHVRKAQALMSLGRTEEALREYLLCLSLEPECRLAKNEAHKLLGDLLAPVTDQVPEQISDYSNIISLRAYMKNMNTPSQPNSQTSLSSQSSPASAPPALNRLDDSDVKGQEKPEVRRLDHSLLLKRKRTCTEVEVEGARQQRKRSKFEREEVTGSMSPDVRDFFDPDPSFVFLLVSSSLNNNVPIFVCTMAFPTVPCPLHIFEPCYRLMIRRCMETGTNRFGMCLEDNLKGFADFGCLLEIRDVKFFSDGRSVVDTIGRRRFKVIQHSERDGYNTADIEYLEDVKVEGVAEIELQSLHDTVYDQALVWVNSLKTEQKERIEGHFGPIPGKDLVLQASPNGPSWCWWLLAVLPLEGRAQLPFLALTSLKDRLSGIRKVLLFMAHSRHR
ncbi:LON peptidase N-terminal domain and RING finger protein 3-like [Labrus mixtus]|uniref:LON peptidase N-terminal domain and RING finger protein 3-like n=1 Tax=Labrus mixtus TaxID=508554 RepID=UPI0029C0821B|nr:LON peptidase N-terminal domain and RING finger protein 3-like [Labrus mixtus]